MKVIINPTKRVRVLGLDERGVEELVWCATASGITRLFWIDGYMLCVEVYEKAFEYETERGFFPISQVCFARSPTYTQVYDVGRGAQLPVVNVSGMKLYQAILKAILKHERRTSKTRS